MPWSPLPPPPRAASTTPGLLITAPLSILRQAPGAYVAGLWVPGKTSSLTIDAGVYSAHINSYSAFDPLPSGQRVGELIKILTMSELYIPDPTNNAGGNAQGGDVALWDGVAPSPSLQWLVIRRIRCAMGVLTHNEYLAARLAPS